MLSYDEAELEAFFTKNVLLSGGLILNHDCQLKFLSLKVAMLHN